MGRVLRRRSGIIERHKALSSAPSGEGVRLAVSVLPLPEHASEVRPDCVAPHESPGPVRQMSLPGIEVSKVEAAECDAVTPEEEAEFQKDLERIRAAENQAATEGRNIILGGDSLG